MSFFTLSLIDKINLPIGSTMIRGNSNNKVIIEG